MDHILYLFSMLSDKTRLRILLMLKDHELCVCELFLALRMSQPRVSRQLALLKQSRLIKDRREGKWIYYRIEENAETQGLLNILAMVSDQLEKDPEIIHDRQMLLNLCALKKNMMQCECNLTGGEEVGE